MRRMRRMRGMRRRRRKRRRKNKGRKTARMGESSCGAPGVGAADVTGPSRLNATPENGRNSDIYIYI
eukprot:9473313-Pyramimonas_sp.AAC.1